MTNEAVPILRFKGFHKSFDSYKLGNLLIKLVLKNKNRKVSNIESISNAYGFIKQMKRFKDRFNPRTNLSNYHVIKPGMFAYNPSRISVGSIAYKKKHDKTSIVSSLYVPFKTRDIIDDLYLLYWFETEYFDKQRLKYSEGGVRLYLFFDRLSEIVVNIPSLQEQRATGRFFSKLDKIIKLQHKKLSLLIKLKRSYLQKLFPSWHKSYPQLRFSKYIGTKYIPEKMRNIILRCSIKNKGENVTNVESISNAHGFVTQIKRFKDRFNPKINLSNYYIIKPGMFAYNPSRISVGSIAYKKKNNPTSIVSSLYVPFKTRKNINDLYLWYWFQTDSFEAQRIKYSEGGVRLYLFFDRLSEMSVSLPSLSEQYDIGQFMKNIDTIIKIQNNKLINLRKLKKAYLQKMFC